MVRWVLGFSLVLASFSFADEQVLQPLFEKHFHKQYVSGRCGDNIRRFVKAVEREFASASDLAVVSLNNQGYSVFGMINVEKARGQRFNKPWEGEANWYHHVFAIDRNGNVYDFDFEKEPRIVPFHEYIDEMFLIEPECEKPTYGEFCAGRDNKLKDYLLESVAGEAVAKNINKENPIKVSLEEAYKDYRVLFQ